MHEAWRVRWRFCAGKHASGLFGRIIASVKHQECEINSSAVRVDNRFSSLHVGVGIGRHLREWFVLTTETSLKTSGCSKKKNKRKP
jgi:hypothetical protein